MTEQSLSQLEQDAERARAELADTTEHLKKKISPGQLIDEVVNYFKDGDTSQTMGNLKNQIRDNPMALAVIGSGLAWLMMGSGSSTYGRATTQSGSPSEGKVSESSKKISGLSSTVSQVAAQVDSATETVTEAVSSISDSVSVSLHDIRDSTQERFTNAATAGEEIGAQIKTTVLDVLDREPLVLGALGIAVGVTIGAMLPSTQTEKEFLGSASAKVQKAAESAVSQGIEETKEVVRNAYSAGREAANKQELTGNDGSLVQKVADATKAVSSELKTAAEQAVKTTEQKVDLATDSLAPGSKPL